MYMTPAKPGNWETVGKAKADDKKKREAEKAKAKAAATAKAPNGDRKSVV